VTDQTNHTNTPESAHDQSWLTALATDDLPAIHQQLRDDPQKARTPLLVDQLWGQEWWLPIHTAADAGSTKTVQALLDASVHPDSRTRYRTPFHARQTALHLAATKGHSAIVQALIDAGADPNLIDAHNQSPLHTAALAGAASTMELLLQAEAITRLKDANGRAPLHLALDAVQSQTGDGARCTKLLLEAGADPDAVAPKDLHKETPRKRAEQLTDESLKASVLALMDQSEQGEQGEQPS